MEERPPSEDRRILRTERVLAEALVRLTLERPYEEISVRDIAAQAGVGYATFFRRYPTKDALLLTVVDVVLDEMLGQLLPLAAGAVEAPETYGAVLGTGLFEYVASHATICQVLLRVRHVGAIRERIWERGSAAVLEGTALGNEMIPPEIGVHHLLMVSMSLVEWWLERGMPYSPERMGVMYDALALRPLREKGHAI